MISLGILWILTLKLTLFGYVKLLFMFFFMLLLNLLHFSRHFYSKWKIVALGQRKLRVFPQLLSVKTQVFIWK